MMTVTMSYSASFSITHSINKLERISRTLDPKFEPREPSKEEVSVHVSTCWPMNFSDELKEKLANVEY